MLQFKFFCQYFKFKHASIVKEGVYAFEKVVSGHNNVQVGSGSIIHN
jgi:hypothetical protein